MAVTVRRATQQRKQEILRAALESFDDRGYAATTLEDIRDRSGASTGSIYHLFRGKEDIAGAVYLEGIRAYQDGFTARLVESTSVEEGVRSSVTYYLGWIEKNEMLARFILNTRQAELVPQVQAELRALNRAFFLTLRERVEPHMRSGVVRTIPWAFFLAIVMGPALEFARQWLAGRVKESPKKAARVLADAAWAALRC